MRVVLVFGSDVHAKWVAAASKFQPSNLIAWALPRIFTLRLASRQPVHMPERLCVSLGKPLQS